MAELAPTLEPPSHIPQVKAKEAKIDRAEEGHKRPRRVEDKWVMIHESIANLNEKMVGLN